MVFDFPSRERLFIIVDPKNWTRQFYGGDSIDILYNDVDLLQAYGEPELLASVSEVIAQSLEGILSVGHRGCIVCE